MPARRRRPRHRRAAERGQELSSFDVACHVTLRLGVIHAMGDDATFPSRGLGANGASSGRPTGNSSGPVFYTFRKSLLLPKARDVTYRQRKCLSMLACDAFGADLNCSESSWGRATDLLPVLPPRRYHTPCARNGRIGKRLSCHSLRVAHTQTVLSGHRWLGAVLGDCAFSISVRHRLKNALMMIGTIGPLELA